MSKDDQGQPCASTKSGPLPAILCFPAGYSSKLVIMMLNKIVEKGEKIIQAL